MNQIHRWLVGDKRDAIVGPGAICPDCGLTVVPMLHYVMAPGPVLVGEVYVTGRVVDGVFRSRDLTPLSEANEPCASGAAS